MCLNPVEQGLIFVSSGEVFGSLPLDRAHHLDPDPQLDRDLTLQQAEALAPGRQGPPSACLLAVGASSAP